MLEPDDRRSSWWPYAHPPIGTCVAGCPSYGRCHCGCSDRPKHSAQTFDRGHRTRGEPSVFCAGHHSRIFPRNAGHWSKNGVPVERVRPLLAWLHERHGTWQAVAELLRMPMSTVKGYANNRNRRRIPPEAAQRISELVLAHRKHRSWLDQWETEPGHR
jgi:hypothetical protein